MQELKKCIKELLTKNNIKVQYMYVRELNNHIAVIAKCNNSIKDIKPCEKLVRKLTLEFATDAANGGKMSSCVRIFGDQTSDKTVKAVLTKMQIKGEDRICYNNEWTV